MRLLIAEDDDSVALALDQALSRAGHETARVTRGSALLLVHREHDAILLDLGLVDGEAFDALRDLRHVSDVPVIVVSARSDERSVVRALHLGADDYIVKPVRLTELLARIDAVRRRHESVAEATDDVSAGGLTIDLRSRIVSDGAGELELTAKEFDLLAALARRAGTAVSREQLLDEVWGDALDSANRSLDVHVAQLRAKVPNREIITTIRGFGYRFEEDSGVCGSASSPP